VAELEVCERLRVAVREVEVLRVGREVERLLAEAVPRYVHGWSDVTTGAGRRGTGRAAFPTPDPQAGDSPDLALPFFEQLQETTHLAADAVLASFLYSQDAAVGGNGAATGPK
jgi:hypothetical protein